MDIFSRKQSVLSCTLLLTILVNFSRAQKPIPDFFSGVPSSCGSTNTLHADDVYFISDLISLEGRKSKAFEEKSKGQKHSGRSFNPIQPSDSHENSHYQPRGSNSLDISSVGFSSSEFHRKNAIYDYDLFKSEQTTEDSNKSQDFYSFMNNIHRAPFRSEQRKFPRPPSRLVEIRPSKRPVKKDILSGWEGNFVGKRRSSNPSRRPNRRDRPGNLPLYIQHMLDAAKNASATTTTPKPVTSGYPYSEYSKQYGGRRSLTSPPRNPNADGGDIMNILGKLEPDKMQQLKQYLGTLGPAPAAKGRPFHDGGDRPWLGGAPHRRDEDEQSYRPEMHGMDSKSSGSKSPSYSPTRKPLKWHSAGSSSENRYRHHDSMENERDNVDQESLEFPVPPQEKIPEAIPSKKKDPRRRFRGKRDTFGAARREHHDDGDDEAATCNWVFRKGADCGRLVVKMQHWIDGVRDCSMEYLSIKGNGHQDNIRLCGGKENLLPYNVQGEKVSVKHFRDASAGPGTTKFKGIIQCEP